MNYIMNFYVKYIPTEHIFLLILMSAVAEFLSKTLNGLLIKLFKFKKGTLICIVSALASSLLFLYITSAGDIKEAQEGRSKLLIPAIILG